MINEEDRGLFTGFGEGIRCNEENWGFNEYEMNKLELI